MLGKADVILHDALVSYAVLDRARRDALFIDVGKRAGNNRGKRNWTQADIHQLMVQHARQGHTVVRLKGGDAFIFGRGGEELEHLLDNGIEYEVVPGITAAAGCAAYAGITLTHRDHAQLITLVTGHLSAADKNAAGKEEGGIASMIYWAAISGPGRTLAVYMGMHRAAQIRKELLDAGIAPSTPAALITNGTLDDQQCHQGNVGSLPSMAKQSQGNVPGLFIIGEVAALGRSLSWFHGQQGIVDGLRAAA